MSSHILIIGLGNPIVGDDGVGWKVAEEIKRYFQEIGTVPANVDIECLSVGGLRLMEFLVGYDFAIIIDMLSTGKHPLGHVLSISLDQLPDFTAGYLTSAHDTSLPHAIKLGSDLGLQLPGKIMIIGIEATHCYDFSDQLSSEIEPAVLIAKQMAIDLLDEFIKKPIPD